ncbi:uncharacterized protein K460DRAFT_282683 [Cucurbitaria berberidis CBS 394.84]|uniref:ASX DEUBAD domain-containing protein n=1 Tax=Cucurbitaria berberidis CBS 394.84 TaxID=1168544 RepID=A0A9P4L7U0_9PLEO|nr:uncharacterized protein K460DRAFT_282683 [Cucurbitaria berberidis CBS 394.84]KAF1844639.1 hypothetical protein K460DRAFT_282683 [Cucurbitaria berberidis CBS 394.84]
MTSTSEPTVSSQPALAPALELDASTMPSPSMVTNSALEQTPKRGRQDEDDEEDTPPPKKPATKPKAQPKPKAVPVTKKTTARKAACTPLTPSNRPTRNRKAPERFEAFEENSKPKALPSKKGSSKVFDPVFITTNSTSRLSKADVYHMLLEGPAWTSLSAEQQSTLISMLPRDPTNQAILERLRTGEMEGTRPHAFSISNDCFRTDVAKFKEDLKNGHLAKTWQATAEQAVVERAAGEFDEWKAEEAELWWGQKSK